MIAIFESRPYWGPELQRQFEHTNVTLREFRSVGDLSVSIVGFGTSLIVLDLDAALVDCVKWLGSGNSEQLLRLPIIAIGSSATAELEWLLREAGVTVFLPDMITGEELAKLCRRQLGIVRKHKQSS